MFVSRCTKKFSGAISHNQEQRQACLRFNLFGGGLVHAIIAICSSRCVSLDIGWCPSGSRSALLALINSIVSGKKIQSKIAQVKLCLLPAVFCKI